MIIRGHNLPGRSFCTAAGEPYGNVHVGLQVRRDPADLVPGDAAAAMWQADVQATIGADGGIDFRGPAVHGTRRDRFLYLTWGNVGPDDSFEMFRRAKLMLNQLDEEVVRRADRSGQSLVASVDLTDGRGGPRCARVDPPAVHWSVEPSAGTPRSTRPSGARGGT